MATDTPRTGDDAGLRAFVADAIKPLVDDTDASYPQIAEGAIRAVRSWDEANAGSVPVAGYVISGPGEYLTRDGRWVTVYGPAPGGGLYPWRVRWETQSSMGSAINEWSVSRQGFYAEPGKESPNDIVAIYALPAPGEAAAPVRAQGESP